MPLTFRIGVELFHQGQQIGLARLPGKLVLEGGHADLDGLLGLVADVDLARRVLADQHHGQAGHEAVAGLERRHLGRDAPAQALGEGLAVDDPAVHCRSVHCLRHPSSLARSAAGSPAR